METIEIPTSITIDGVAYPLGDFSETVHRLVSIHTAWRGELMTERLAVSKTEAAIRALDAELSGIVQAELKAKAEASTAEAE